MRLRRHFGIETTVVPILRQDGTVHFRRAPKPLSERLCDWGLVFLWLLVPMVTIASILWA